MVQAYGYDHCQCSGYSIQYKQCRGGGYYSLIGIALALTAALSYSAYGLLSKRYLKKFTFAHLTGLDHDNFCSVIYAIIHFDPAPVLYLKLEDIFKILILGTVCSAPVYVLYQKF